MNQGTITAAIGIGGAVVGFGVGAVLAANSPEPDVDTGRKIVLPIAGAGLVGAGIVLASTTSMRIPMGVQCAGYAVAGLVPGLGIGAALGSMYRASL